MTDASKQDPDPGGTRLQRAAVLADRAAGELRRGRPIAVLGESEAAAMAAAETIGEEMLAELAGQGPVRLALTLNRAHVLHVRTATSDPVLLPVARRMTAGVLRDLADPTTDLTHPLLGPFTAERRPASAAAAAAIALCKRARLLPAAVLVLLQRPAAEAWAAAGDRIRLALDEVQAAEAAEAGTLRLVTSAQVPLAGAEAARIIAFRPADGALEHLAIIIGDPRPSEPTLIRLHSECFTGDLLGSLRCDCGEQLRGAIALLAAAGGGILLYLAQEGRGIGLINKLRAYRLQDQGFDTVDANLRLGFAADERLFDPAARMLRLLGFGTVRLLTNNPEKVRGLERCGISVIERVPHAFPSNAHNEAYLATKKKRSGHYL